METKNSKNTYPSRPWKILLGILPYWDPMIPPNGIAHLKTFLQKHGYEVKTFDFIVHDKFAMFYKNYSETLRAFIPETNQGNFLNIMHDVLQNHLMAHWNYDDEEEYAALVKELVYKSYYFVINQEQTRELIQITAQFYIDLEACYLRLLEEEKPQVLGLTAYKCTLPASLYALRLTRRHYPHIWTLMGGGTFADNHLKGSPSYHALLELSADYVDNIVIGQGELIFLKLLQGELPRTQRVFTKADIGDQILDSPGIDLPDYSDFDIDRYPYIPATASAGCPNQCTFCVGAKFSGKFRRKAPQLTVSEMIKLSEIYGKQLFFMTDSILNPVVTDLANEFIKSGVSLYYDSYFRVDEPGGNIETTLLWRRGGLYRVRLGTESGSQKVLDAMNKGITLQQIKATVSALAYAGIKTTTYWVIGHPGETEADFQMTLDLVEELKDDIFQAECNPFLYHYSGQFASDQWFDKRMLLYPEKYLNMLVFKSWTLNQEPLRQEAYRRMHRFEAHCRKLGIPNPYSVNEYIAADQRWKKLHKNAVPAMIEFQKKNNPINENKKIKPIIQAKNRRQNDGDFAF